MRTRISRTAVVAGAGVAAFVTVGSVDAHHSATMFEPLPVWLKGTVVSYESMNPHARIVLAEQRADGQHREWVVEGTSPNNMARLGIPADFLVSGDAIEVCGFPLKEQYRKRDPADGPSYPTQFVHGQLLVMPDGQRRMWGSYGKLDNCVRPGDGKQPWADFLNGDARAFDAWCTAKRLAAQPSPPGTTALVAEIDALLAAPCG